MADPKKVIKKAWKDNEQNKEISVYGKAIKLTHLVIKDTAAQPFPAIYRKEIKRR